ncbi:MAG: transglycosylase domain-containing protein, partial [Roseimicrobium sp.]
MSSRLQRWRTGTRTTLAAGALIAGVWWALPWSVRLPDRLLRPLAISPTFIAADGSPLRQLLNSEGQRADPPVDFGTLPSLLIHATLAAEDRRFFSHDGVDLTATVRAAWSNLKAGRVVSGASTITQQLVKISANQRQERTAWAKITESLQA